MENGDGQKVTRVLALLKACGKQKDLLKGTKVHHDILRKGLLEKNSYVASALVHMYAKCGALAKAARVVSELPVQDVVSWNALIAEYVNQGAGEQALKFYDQLRNQGLYPDAVTYICVLKACGCIGASKKGEQIHNEIIRWGLLGTHLVLANSLVDMYVKCGALAKAAKVLNELLVRDVVTWSTLIAGYAQHGQGTEALKCFESMQSEGLSPNAFTYACILKACGSMGELHKGNQIHIEILTRGLMQEDIVLGNALIDMYAKCSELGKARQVLDELPFRDVVSWSSLIAQYADEEQGENALICFDEMQCEGLFPDTVIISSVLKACINIGASDKWELIHNDIVREGLTHRELVLGNTLIDMYAKCGALPKAAQVLNHLCGRDVVSWSTLIAGYAQHGQGKEALKCFDCMQLEGLSPDRITFICILKACGNIGATDRGERIHEDIVRRGLLRKDILLGNALVDMYAKCGALTKAAVVLDELCVRDVVTWNVLIAGHAQHGYGEEALKCFERMQEEGLSPGVITLTCVLTACSHAGLLTEGETYFTGMATKHGITPDIGHHACMVDLFSRAGQLEKALALVKRMACFSSLPVWLALLGSCKKWGNMNVGRLAFENAVQMEKDDAAAYILMNTVYSAIGK